MKGILGGTFDPPHLGHLVLAEEARLRFDLERVFFVPSVLPPHKVPASLTSFHHRMEMTRLATGSNPYFEVSEMERALLEDSDGTDAGETPHGSARRTYTVDLLGRFGGMHGRPALIIGMDSLCELHTWRRPMEILDLARVVAGTRPGYTAGRADRSVAGRVETFEIPDVHVSSTLLRERFARGMECRYLTPASVAEYAVREGIYAG